MRTKIEVAANGGGNPTIKRLGYLKGKITQHFTVYSPEGLAPTLNACDRKSPTKIEVDFNE